MFWDCSVELATASKMPERLRPNAVTKRATGAEKKQHGQRRVRCETDATETTICSFRGEASATFTAICENGNRVIRNESCILCEATTFANDRKWTSGSTRSTRTSVRQLYPLDSATPSEVEVKNWRQLSSRHTDTVQEKWANFGVFCALQLVSELAGWYDESRPSNAKWCKEWKSTEWSDVVLPDLVRPTLESLILACCDAADGTLFCVDTRADGRKMCENKDILLLRMRESEHRIAQLRSLSVIGEKLRSSSATMCPTDRIESATEVVSELLQRAWITTRYRTESEKRASSMQALDNAKTDEKSFGIHDGQ